MPMIQIAGVTKTFPGRQGSPDLLVIDGFTLDVPRGEFLSIVGPSGCGKSTILMLIAGLVAPDSGSLTIDGQSPAEARVARKFGIVFQDPVLFGWRTIRENVELPGEVLRDAAIRKRAREALVLVGLDGFQDAYPHELSGGMRSRAAIARALALHPQILLMDEPFADLDELTRCRLNLEVLRIRKQTNATVVFVTHSVQEAAFLSDRVIVVTGRPASVVAELRINLEEPRTLAMMDSLPFLQTVAALRGHLNSPLANSPAATLKEAPE